MGGWGKSGKQESNVQRQFAKSQRPNGLGNRGRKLEVKFERFLEIRDGVCFRVTLAGNIWRQVLCNKSAIFFIDYVVYFGHSLHPNRA